MKAEKMSSARIFFPFYEPSSEISYEVKSFSGLKSASSGFFSSSVAASPFTNLLNIT